MAELERLGFIAQPHTSAGRVPTDKGYRLYVNSLTEGHVAQPHRVGQKTPWPRACRTAAIQNELLEML